jgi:hypothetical protein
MNDFFEALRKVWNQPLISTSRMLSYNIVNNWFRRQPVLDTVVSSAAGINNVVLSSVAGKQMLFILAV